MKTTSQSGSILMAPAGVLLPRLQVSLALLERGATYCVLGAIQSSIVKRKSQPYSENLNREILAQVVRHEQASMQEYYKPGRTRSVVLKRLAKLQKYLRRARLGHSRPN